MEANIGVHDDVELAIDNGADGVGLLRIEQLYFTRPNWPGEKSRFTIFFGCGVISTSLPVR